MSVQFCEIKNKIVGKSNVCAARWSVAGAPLEVSRALWPAVALWQSETIFSIVRKLICNIGALSTNSWFGSGFNRRLERIGESDSKRDRYLSAPRRAPRRARVEPDK